MSDITLISGSTLGSAEYVTEHLESLLQQDNFTTTLLHGPEWDEVTPENVWLVVTSTHGAGDLPDNLQPFYEELQEKRPDLSAVRYGAIGIGSSEYDTFCGAIVKLDQLLQDLGAHRIGDILKIDITQHDIPEDPAEVWLGSWKILLK
ncbi:FMN-binding protein MioC [Dickeya oryzae]|uniref:FMN-binding protein MioC n=1 Tax=Dickeya oryzae TaxID=1240404 RepID=A0AB39IT32_9GAMM|nr:FMN-binding protein MioC [Dickeya oryzae]MBP2857746.1 FMN-binding protein MioC [Dickeya oryzae]MCA6990134.1 FMN-binding protein MioC [Dickeya oryzae]MCA6994995.1 FMN-binding protein MioC [Dickeya oryzae]